jgi:hypothetical protein
MGYSTDRMGRLCCDACGQAGNVRKRQCPFKVLTDSLRGPRVLLHYCSPPALCPECYEKHKATLHDRCRHGAAASQVEYDLTEAALDAGDAFSVCAWGDWKDGVPKGMVGVCFKSRQGERYCLVPQAEHSGGKPLSAYSEVIDWTDHPGTTTKLVDSFTLEA